MTVDCVEGSVMSSRLGYCQACDCGRRVAAVEEGVRAQAEAPGYGGPPTVWASGGGEQQIAYGVPVGGDALKFRFHPGHPVYTRLVSTPGLRATFVVDRGSSQILGVRFRGR
jgi:hypothetical protein